MHKTVKIMRDLTNVASGMRKAEKQRQGVRERERKRELQSRESRFYNKVAKRNGKLESGMKMILPTVLGKSFNDENKPK